LKFILDQLLSTVPQHQWLSKLFRFDFTIEYRLGQLNSTVDVLSHRDEDVVAACALSGLSFEHFNTIRHAIVTDLVARDLLQ
jgi:hypothetical protein